MADMSPEERYAASIKRALDVAALKVPDRVPVFGPYQKYPYGFAGVTLKDGPTRPAQVEIIAEPKLWPRNPPIRFRKDIPTTWLRLVISEGRNRQVRRMTAHIDFPTLRLVRWRIGEWTLSGIPCGEYRKIP